MSILAGSAEGGGAALDQVIGLTVAAAVVTAALLWIGYLHRARRISWLNNLAERMGRKFGGRRGWRCRWSCSPRR